MFIWIGNNRKDNEINQIQKNIYFSRTYRKIFPKEFINEWIFEFFLKERIEDFVKNCYKKKDLELFKLSFEFVEEKNFTDFVYYISKCTSRDSSHENFTFLNLALENFSYPLNFGHKFNGYVYCVRKRS